jgi:nitrate/nitrite-specific signal transduction histidine kinase
MAQNGNSLDQRTFGKLRRLYIIGFSTIALSVIISQILIRKHLSGQESDSRVINIAGRQRMLSQKLAKDVLSLNVTSNLQNKLLIKDDLKQTLALWEFSHNALQNGNDSLSLPKKNSDEIIKKFSL